MKTAKLYLAIIFMVLLADNVASFGVAPSSRDIIFVPGAEQESYIRIINNEHKNLSVRLGVEGELSGLVTLNLTEILVGRNDTSKIVWYRIRLPQNLEPGVHTAKIIVIELPRKVEGQTALGSRVGLVSKINVIVPYPGLYARIKIRPSLVLPYQKSNLAVDIFNLGQQPITNATLGVDIIDNSKGKVDSLTSIVSVEPKDSLRLILNWTPQLPNGLYRARAVLNYDSKQATDETDIEVGKPVVVVTGINIENFVLGEINRFVLSLERFWNVPLELTAELTIEDYSGRVLAISTSPRTEVLAARRASLEALVNTANLKVGFYRMRVKLYYSKQVTEQIFTLKIMRDSIRIWDANGRLIYPKPVLPVVLLIVLWLFIINFVVIVLSLLAVMKRSRRLRKK
mgnify:CR=1 FL=1